MKKPKISRGMRVQVQGGGPDIWTVLEHHPAHGTWWLHRRNTAGDWETSFALYTKLNQVFK